MTAGSAGQPIRDRSPERRRRRWPIFLAAGLVLALAAGAVYVLWFTAVLGVKKVTVTGVTDDLAAQVRDAVNLPDGTPLIRVDVRAAEQRVDEVPEVASATVIRRWPDAVVVAVLARTPVAVTSANGGLWLLDSGGTPYLRVSAAPPGLITVQLATPGSGDAATVAALKVVGSMTAEFRVRVAAVTAPSPYGIRLLLKDGRTVFWGGSDNGAQKMRVLPALLDQPGRGFNISVPGLATANGR